MSYKIETGIPIPDRGGKKFPFGDMAPGDSFLAPLEGYKSHETLRARIHTAAKARGFEVVTRKSGDEGLRVWLIGRTGDEQ